MSVLHKARSNPLRVLAIALLASVACFGISRARTPDSPEVGNPAAAAARSLRAGMFVTRSRKEVPVANLWLSLLDRMGTPVDRFGDSTGRLSEL